MDISAITDYLFVGAEPVAGEVKQLAAQHIQLIISMRGEARPPTVFGQEPLRLLWLPSYDTFLTPIAMGKLMQGVEAAREVVEKGGRVLVYCQRGRHRSIVMAAAILIAAGHTGEQAIALLRRQRITADPNLWYVRRQIFKFEKMWQAREANPLGVE